MGIFDFWKKPEKKPVNVDEDHEIVTVFFNEVGEDIEGLRHLCEQMKKLRDNYNKLVKSKAADTALKVNVQEQIQTYDKLLQLFRFLDEDVELNGIRAKMVGEELAKQAKQLNIDPEILKLTKQQRWVYNW